MASIPLPALDIKPPQQPDMMGDVSKLMALKSLQNQQQMQGGQLQLQQQQIKDQQARTKALAGWDGKNPDDLTKSVLHYGGSADAAAQEQQRILGIRDTASQIALRDAQTGASQVDTIIKKHDQYLGAINSLENVPDEQLHQSVASHIDQLIPDGSDPQAMQMKQQVQQLLQSNIPPDQLRQKLDDTKAQLQGSKEQFVQAQTAAQTAKEKADAAAKTAEKKWYEDNPSAGAPGVPAETVSLADYMRQPQQPGEAKHTPANFDAWKATQKEVSEATNPAIQNAKLQLAVRTKRAEQVISQGDPAAAGKLLADGSLTLSELKSRGTTPDFIVQATNAAQKASPGWNAQKADADFKVASSPSNVAFFGSAKSLTDPGGTLDQLEAAAKDIPDGKIPVFNSVADAYKAATGSGPVAKYASILVGVSDDYSKVMGGGQGSDSSRSQALKLAPTSASPEARHAAVEGIRGAVGSQIKSRIGKNTVLQNMYGEASQTSSPVAPGSAAELRQKLGLPPQ